MVIGFDIDGTFTRFEQFTKKYAVKYFKNKYNLDVVNPDGYDVDDIFDLESYIRKTQTNLLEEEIQKEVKKMMAQFWTVYYPLYIAAPFREGVKKIIESEKSKGNVVKLFSSRDMTCDENLKGKIAREATHFQINLLNNIKHDGLLLYPDDKTKIEDIKKHRVSIMFEDKPEMIEGVSQFAKVIAIKTPYNQNYDFNDNVIMVDGENAKEIDQALGVFKEILNKPLLDNGAIKHTLPSKDQIWKKYYKTKDNNYVLERMSPYDRMMAQIKDYPNDTLFSYSNTNKKMKVKEYIEKVELCANWLKNQGIQKGDLVPVITLNTFETVIMISALIKINATVVPISPLENKASIEAKLNDLKKPLKMVYLVDFWHDKEKCYTSDKIKDLVDKNEIEKVCYAKVDFFSLPFIDRLKIIKKIIKNGKFPEKSKNNDNDKFVYFDEIIENKIYNNKTDNNKYDGDYTACLMYTSGTLVSKGVKLSGNNIDAIINYFYNSLFDINKQEKISGFLPYDHVYGLLTNLIVPVALGLETVLVPNFERNKINTLVTKDKVSYLILIPVLLNNLIENKKITSKELRELKKIFSGSSVINNLNEIEHFFNKRGASIDILDGYGSSELTCIYLADGIPVLDSNAKVVDVETNKELGYNKVGELHVTGPTVMKGYYNNDDLTNEVLYTDENGDEWLKTGDLFSVSKDGKFHFQGRVSQDFIKVNGKQVNLYALKQLIETIDEVKECVIIDIIDSEKGRVPIAFIEPLEKHYNINHIEQKIINLCKQKLASYERPVYIHFVDKLPLTMRGKTDRKYIEDNYEDIIANNNLNKTKVLVKTKFDKELKAW